jgi:hypothetical protein
MACDCVVVVVVVDRRVRCGFVSVMEEKLDRLTLQMLIGAAGRVRAALGGARGSEERR